MKLTDIEVNLLRTTKLALLVESQVGEAWVPRSFAEFEPNNGLTEDRWKFPVAGTLSMSLSFAVEKGLV